MPEIETMLREAIAHGTEGSPPVGLADRARIRARARRQRKVGVTVAAGLAVAVAAGIAMVVPDRDGPGPADEPAPVRLESWRDASVEVPASWGEGELGDACGTGQTAPVVERDAPLTPLIRCEPMGYGVQFSDGSTFDPASLPGHVWRYVAGDVDEYPGGAWMGYQITDERTLVRVVLPTEAEVERVLASFRQNDDVDGNGCTSRVPVAGPSPRPQGDDVRLCRYGEDGWLEVSRTLTGDEAADAVDALWAAPRQRYRNDAACWRPEESVVVRYDWRYARLVLGACGRIDGWSGDIRKVTIDVVLAVLGPSGDSLGPG
jgi:hypothetical protein